MAPQDASTWTLATGRLGSLSLVLLALAATTPLTVVTTAVPAAHARGETGFVPAGFVAVGLIVLCFATGYAAMSGRGPHAGALYAFIARGLGRPVGVGGAWVALIAYHALQIGLYGAVGAAAAPLLTAWFGAAAPWWLVAAICWLVVAVCGTARVDVVAGLLGLLVLVELAVIGGVAVASLLHPSDGRITWAGMVPPGGPADRPALGLLLVAAAFAFVGFEATAAFGEEAIRPRRSGRSTYAVVLLLAVLYPIASWAMSVAAGPQVAALAAARGPELWFDLTGERFAPWAVTLGRMLVLTGLLAGLVALHHVIARYAFALSREGLLPRPLGRARRRTSAPRAASLTQSTIAAAAIVTAAVLDPDPPTEMVRWLTVTGALGMFLLLTATALATLIFLNRSPSGENVWVRFLAPGLATVGLGALAYLAFAQLPTLLGVPGRAPLVWIVPAGYALVLLAGMGYGHGLRKARPIRYAGIGLGGSAVVGTPSVPKQSVPKQRAPGAHRPERVKR
ncbi:APC family permease [Jidongwangia harbinensis]|uniref:APC family permease n=1 Tax=Jidongwangia harbinensis TaxID=2878561 RepID=UPI001CD98695|nr:APC family permease [Jidongwangia harbinensis]MCA2214415.1 APC family permease [Jidongwangia harbinensis]